MTSFLYYLNLFGSDYHLEDKPHIRYTLHFGIESASRSKFRFVTAHVSVIATLAARWGYQVGSRKPKSDYESLEYTLINLTYREIERRIIDNKMTAHFNHVFDFDNAPHVFPRYSKESAHNEYKIELPILKRV